MCFTEWNKDFIILFIILKGEVNTKIKFVLFERTFKITE